MLMTILVGATVFVLLVFIVFQVLQAPLVVVDARSDMAKENPIASEKMLLISVQGPIVDLPKRISRLVHQLIYYRAAGTSLQWLDFDPEKGNAVKVSGIARRKVEVQNLKAPFDCAACQGFLHPMQTGWLFAFLCALWSLAVLLPVTIYVAQTSGNGVEHTMVTFACFRLCFLSLIFLFKTSHVPGNILCIDSQIEGDRGILRASNWAYRCTPTSPRCMAHSPALPGNAIFGSLERIPKTHPTRAVCWPRCNASSKSGFDGHDPVQVVEAL